MSIIVKTIKNGNAERIHNVVTEDKGTYVVARPVPPEYDLNIRVFDKATFEVIPVTA